MYLLSQSKSLPQLLNIGDVRRASFGRSFSLVHSPGLFKSETVSSMHVQMLEDEILEDYDQIAIVDEHDNVVGHAPILSRHDAAKMNSDEAHDYMNTLADAAGLREEFEQMQEDLQVRHPSRRFTALYCIHTVKHWHFERCDIMSALHAYTGQCCCMWSHTLVLP